MALSSRSPQREPSRAQTLFEQARSLHTSGRLDEAIALYNQVLALAPDAPIVSLSLGVALRAKGKFEAAVACYRLSLQHDPQNGITYSNLGNALKDLSRFDESLAAHERGIALTPGSPETRYNYGVALKAAGRLREALATFEEALAINPDHADAQWDRALLLLHFGDYARGWPAYESRWRQPNHRPPQLRQPRWDGAPFPGRRLLLTTEQGFGDTLQFARFIRLAKARGGEVALQCQPSLVRLMRTAPGLDLVASREEPAVPCDVHSPLLSLPALLGVEVGDLPGPVPYLQANAADAEKFRPLLARAGDKKKVAVVWSGSVTFRANHLRAVKLEQLLPLATVPNVQLFSLQMGAPRAELETSGVAGLFTDLTPLIDDFADTAALLNELDLVVMTDSSVAHLGGALGRPVWVLLGNVPDWRWFETRHDSPWYPSLRLFRQQEHNQWAPVIAAVVAELTRWAAR